MSREKQTSTLEWFKSSGKKVLVSTDVCEEGVNVTCCELVIRYSPAMSGN